MQTNKTTFCGPKPSNTYIAPADCDRANATNSNMYIWEAGIGNQEDFEADLIASTNEDHYAHMSGHLDMRHNLKSGGRNPSQITQAEFQHALHSHFFAQQPTENPLEQMEMEDISGMLDNLDVQELPNQDDMQIWGQNDASCGGQKAESDWDIHSHSTYISYLPEPVASTSFDLEFNEDEQDNELFGFE